MGGLWRYLPITWLTSLIGTLSLIGFPGFAGFFSKDAMIEAVGAATHGPVQDQYAWWCLMIGVFVTALYSFRMFFLVFHGAERLDRACEGASARAAHGRLVAAGAARRALGDPRLADDRARWFSAAISATRFS